MVEGMAYTGLVFDKCISHRKHVKTIHVFQWQYMWLSKKVTNRTKMIISQKHYYGQSKMWYLILIVRFIAQCGIHLKLILLMLIEANLKTCSHII